MLVGTVKVWIRYLLTVKNCLDPNLGAASRCIGLSPDTAHQPCIQLHLTLFGRITFNPKIIARIKKKRFSNCSCGAVDNDLESCYSTVKLSKTYCGSFFSSNIFINGWWQKIFKTACQCNLRWTETVYNRFLSLNNGKAPMGGCFLQMLWNLVWHLYRTMLTSGGWMLQPRKSVTVTMALAYFLVF